MCITIKSWLYIYFLNSYCFNRGGVWGFFFLNGSGEVVCEWNWDGAALDYYTCPKRPWTLELNNMWTLVRVDTVHGWWRSWTRVSLQLIWLCILAHRISCWKFTWLRGGYSLFKHWYFCLGLVVTICDCDQNVCSIVWKLTIWYCWSWATWNLPG